MIGLGSVAGLVVGTDILVDRVRSVVARRAGAKPCWRACAT
jgi:hypothetical protein